MPFHLIYYSLVKWLLNVDVCVCMFLSLVCNFPIEKLDRVFPVGYADRVKLFSCLVHSLLFVLTFGLLSLVHLNCHRILFSFISEF